MFRTALISLFVTSAMLAVPLTMTHAEQVGITIDGEFEDITPSEDGAPERFDKKPGPNED